jgi:hypothetical protein
MFGEDVFSAMSAFFAGKVLCDNRGAFVLGCQGPDIFYHNQRTKPVSLQYGSLLHRRGFGDFSACLLKNGRVGAQTGALGAYAMGFTTHAFLDRACHPYIIYRGANYHSFFERIIDVLMLKKLRGLVPASWDQEIVLAEVCENPPSALKELIAVSLVETFPERAGKDRNLARRIDNAFSDSARFYNMSSPSKIASAFCADSNEKRPVFTRRALHFVYPQNLPEEIDFLNLNHSPWRYPHICKGGQHPPGDTRSFLDIYSGAVKTAVDALSPCFARYFENGELMPDMGEKIDNMGLSIQNEEGRPCAPNLTDPLPLEQVMEQQAKLRGVP